MSTAEFSSPGVGSLAARTRLRLTTRGRRLLAGVIAVPIAAILSFSVLAGGNAEATRSAGDTSFTTVVVAPGETLWAIAERVAPGSDPRDTIDAITRLNALDSPVLAVGDELAIPHGLG